jgi:hypothetical protein
VSANDNGARPVFFQTPGGASAFALRCAQQESPTRRARELEFVKNAFQAVEGGKVFEFASAAPSDDYAVREVPAVELARRTRSGMRGAVASLEEKAKAHDAAANLSRMGAVRAMHQRYAREARDAARDIETRLVLSGVRDVEPITSSERDSRFLEAR